MNKEIQSLFKLYIVIICVMLFFLFMGCAPMPAVKFTRVNKPTATVTIEQPSPIQIEIDEIENEIKDEAKHIVKTKDKKEREKRSKRVDELHRRLHELKRDSKQGD